MIQSEFDTVLQHRIDHIKDTLAAKSKGYSTGGDKLHNFRTAARLKGETMEKALEGMRVKHDVSIMDMINNPGSVTEAMIDEKIGDRINYDILLAAVFIERIRTPKQPATCAVKVRDKVTPIEDLVGVNTDRRA